MRADNTHHVVAAARRRADATRERAVAALRRMDAAGQPVTFDTVSREAQVSRSWLYNQPDLRAEIERRRQATGRTPSPPVPARQRTSEASLHARLDAALARNRVLAEDNQRLRRQLAHALGEQRTPATGRTGKPPPRNNPNKSPTTIGPC